MTQRHMTHDTQTHRHLETLHTDTRGEHDQEAIFLHIKTKFGFYRIALKRKDGK